MKGALDGQVLLTTTFDYEGVSACNAVALIPTDFRVLRPTSQYFRDPEGLSLKAFDLVATDRFAKRYLKGNEGEVGTLKLACDEHNVRLVVVIHHAELILPERFHDRQEEEEFHEDRMLRFARKSMANHPDVRILPVYIRITNDGEMLEYVSFEDLIHGDGKKEVVWRAQFSLRNVISCKYLLSICLDFRFRKESFDFVFASLKIPYYHLLGTPGSCRGIIQGNEAALVNVEKAIKAGAEEGVILQHQGCAAYKNVICGMSSYEEERYQRDQLSKGGAILKKMGLKDVFLSYVRLTPSRLIEFILVK
jgi:hypothetical protein